MVRATAIARRADSQKQETTTGCQRCSAELVDMLDAPLTPGEQHVVVPLPGADHLESQRGHERQVERAPAWCVRVIRWWRGVERVAEVHGDVARLSGERDDRVILGFACARQPGGSSVRSRDHLELPGVRRGSVKLDSHVEQGTLHGVAAHAAITVPWQVGEPTLGPGHFYDDTVPIEAILGIPEVCAAQCGDVEEPGIGARELRSGETRR